MPGSRHCTLTVLASVVDNNPKNPLEGGAGALHDAYSHVRCSTVPYTSSSAGAGVAVACGRGSPTACGSWEA